MLETKYKRDIYNLEIKIEMEQFEERAVTDLKRIILRTWEGSFKKKFM